MTKGAIDMQPSFASVICKLELRLIYDFTCFTHFFSFLRNN